jgi:surface carbohydrate biosynthesis protein
LKTRLISPKKTNILVYDCPSVEFLKEAVLYGLDYGVLITPNTYFCNGKILLFFVSGLFKISWKYIKSENFSYQSLRGQFFIAYLYASVKCINPKTIVTFCDNDWRFHFLSQICIGPKFISIQNGARTDWSFVKDLPKSNFHPGKKIISQTMFTFGEVEAELFQKYQHNIDEIIPVGSLRSSLFFKKKIFESGRIDKKIYDLLLISQWGQGHMIGTSFPEIRKSIDLTCFFLKKWLEDKRIYFAIALRSDDPSEALFYKNFFKGCQCLLIKKNEDSMSSYLAAYHSDVIVTLDSTLGREAYAWGKKVFFVNLTGDDLYKTPTIDDLYFNKESYVDFADSLNRICAEDYAGYLDRTKLNRDWLIKSPLVSPYSHEIVRAKILRILNEV